MASYDERWDSVSAEYYGKFPWFRDRDEEGYIRPAEKPVVHPAIEALKKIRAERKKVKRKKAIARRSEEVMATATPSVANATVTAIDNFEKTVKQHTPRRLAMLLKFSNKSRRSAPHPHLSMMKVRSRPSSRNVPRL